MFRCQAIILKRFNNPLSVVRKPCSAAVHVTATRIIVNQCFDRAINFPDIPFRVAVGMSSVSGGVVYREFDSRQYATGVFYFSPPLLRKPENQLQLLTGLYRYCAAINSSNQVSRSIESPFLSLLAIMSLLWLTASWMFFQTTFIPFASS